MNTKTYRKENVKPATVNRELSLLKTMFNKAIRDEKLEKNPVKGVKHLKENNERERVLSFEEWEGYKAQCPSWYLPVATMAYLTGMRRGEIINLSHSRVDLKAGFIRLRPEDTKTERGRYIPIQPELMKVLERLLKVRSLKKAKSPEDDKVFHRNDRPVTGSLGK